MKLPLVSIIIPAYNAEKYLVESIDSVLGQSYSNVECIVVDDGSTDATPDICRDYGNRIVYLRQVNSERSAARNNGLTHAQGEYIGFLDADDLLAPQKIAEQVEFLTHNPGVDVAYAKVLYFIDGPRRSFYSVRRPGLSGDIADRLIYSNFITVNSPLIRKRAIEASGGFDVGLSHYEDWDLLLRLALSGATFGFQDAFHAFCRMHEGNTVRDRIRMFKAKWQVAQKIVDALGTELDRRGIDQCQVLSFHQADYGRMLILNGQVTEGRQMIREACRYSAFPHRNTFRLFSVAAGVLGGKPMAALQSWLDQRRKYHREPAP